MAKVRLSKSPASPGIERVENFEMYLTVPYSDSDATVKINPKTNVENYQENADQEGVQVRQMLVVSDTPETQTFVFNTSNKKTQNVTVKGRNFDITLDSIQKEGVPGFDGMEVNFYSFTVEEK